MTTTRKYSSFSVKDVGEMALKVPWPTLRVTIGYKIENSKHAIYRKVPILYVLNIIMLFMHLFPA